MSGKPTTYTLTIDSAELCHLHACLSDAKNQATKDGRIWKSHGLNAHLRTRLENLR